MAGQIRKVLVSGICEGEAMVTESAYLVAKSKKPIVSRLVQRAAVGTTTSSNSGFCLSAAFWDQFVKHQWSREALIIKKPFSSPISSTEEILVALKKASDEFETNSKHVEWVFYRGEDGFQLEGPRLRQYVPLASDRSMWDYARRINSKLKGECFGLVLHELQHYHPEFYLRTREFLSSLAARVGLHWRAMPGLFIGNYQQTPFGIHQDPANVFDFIIEGVKRIYLWPEDYFRDSFDKLRDSDFATLRRDATVLEGKAGDVLYWPGRYWHVGESVGDLSISVSVALMPVELSDSILNEIKNHVAELAEPAPESASGFPRTTNDVAKSRQLIAATVRKATQRLARAHHDSDFIRSLQVSWLNHMTSGGSVPPPPPLPMEMLSDNSYVCGIPELPLVWIAGSDNELICSANGYSFTVPAAPNVIKLLKHLNSGTRLRVGQLVEDYTGVSRRNGVRFSVTDEGIRFLLSKLYSLRAIRKDDSGLKSEGRIQLSANLITDKIPRPDLISRKRVINSSHQ